jgi:hypothetical protein
MSLAQKGFSIAEAMIILVVLSAIGFIGFHIHASQARNTSSKTTAVSKDPVFNTACTNNPHPTFTADLTDPSYISFIQPMGLGGILPRFRTFLNINAATAPAKIPIYAPVDSTFVQGVYKSIKGTTDYDLHFVASCQVWYLVNHVSDPIASIRQALPSTPQTDTRISADQLVAHPITFKAGELIGYTTGTNGARNFDFGVYDNNHTNQFANLTRYKDAEGAYSKYLTAVCPYDYFTPAKKTVYYSKFGENNLDGPVPNATCGQINQDVAGSISGMWFAGDTSTGVGTINLMVGTYIDQSVQISGSDISPSGVLKPSDTSYADPAKVTHEHCYQTNGMYYYFHVVSASQIQLATGTGACPAGLPATGAKPYYR